MTIQFETLSALLSMSGHGAYVWASYALSFFCLSILVIIPCQRRRQQRHQLLKRLQRQQAMPRSLSNRR
ncbi:MAG: heme exporter protein CcmD [Cellvibrionaceae bacterium]|nr:heme exporter protein CcmD [Cellvibrionaceae bacterium]